MHDPDRWETIGNRGGVMTASISLVKTFRKVLFKHWHVSINNRLL